MQVSRLCRFLGRLHDVAIHVRRRQASEKRQGTTSRLEWAAAVAAGSMGIWPQQASLGWCTGGTGWVAATGSRALEDSWTSGKGVEALAGGCCEPRVRRNGTHRVVADR